MTVELVAIGTELLLGETVDTNGAWLARRLAAAGVSVARRTAVPDREADIADAVEAALRRTGGVLCTGGLGPTPDDLTKPVVARLFGRALHRDDAVLAAIEERFRQRGMVMAERNRAQADVPEGAGVLHNERGTAPGLWLEDERGFAVVLPGVPQEMRALFDGQVLPRLEARWPDRVPLAWRTIRTTGIAESAVAEALHGLEAQIEPLALAFLPSFEGTDIRLTGPGDPRDEAVRAAFDRAEGLVRERLGGYVYGLDDTELTDVVAELLVQRGATLALAESCTGGLVAKRLTDRPGASRYLRAGVVAYADEAKRDLLEVDEQLLAGHGAVSEAVARAMVGGARRVAGTDAAISITGIAGPSGGTAEKPVGTVWIGAALDDEVEVRHARFGGDREEIRRRSAQAALALLWQLLREDGP